MGCVIQNLAIAVLVPAVLCIIYREFLRFSIKHIRGPQGSVLRGNVRELFYQKNVGDMDFLFTKAYGLAWRMKAPFGQDILMAADPKALQHIFHKSGYEYGKSVDAVVTANMLHGKSILSVRDGQDHSRHRKVMNPAFSAPQLRSFLPLFQRNAEKLCRLLKQETSQQGLDGQLVAINGWVSRTALDIIGEAAFQYEYGALDDAKNEVCEAYKNLSVKVRMHPSVLDTIFRATWRFLPFRLLDFVEYLPAERYRSPRATRQVIESVASTLVAKATQDAQRSEVEKDQKDVMSVLARANVSENPLTQLSKEEMMSQVGALTFAGHETSANTLSWMLWELSKHPHFQDRLRSEIRAKREELRSRGVKSGNADLSIEDLEGIPFLQAIVKETLRFHPIVYHLTRVAQKDDVIPLSEPISTVNGDTINEIPIAKGQTVLISICAYNRIKKIWGEDADVFNPMRFIEGAVEPEYKVGMYSNLMTFSAGLRGCIGWKFALIEMQAIVVALVENFDFSLPPEDQDFEVVRKPLVLMCPMVKGRHDEGVLMPLIVKAL